MIQLPRRSVTRFFIPLIDVLILLFCIFLLMPLVKAPSATGDPTPPAPEERVRELEAEIARLKREQGETPEKLREELERLRQEKMQVLQERLSVRVLEIDPATGRLVYHDPERHEVTSQAAALELIERDRRAQAGGKRELYYLILYPRNPSSRFPLREQKEQYERWLKDVAHGWDVPGSVAGKGETP
jgi:hypothetical protein